MYCLSGGVRVSSNDADQERLVLAELVESTWSRLRETQPTDLGQFVQGPHAVPLDSVEVLLRHNPECDDPTSDTESLITRDSRVKGRLLLFRYATLYGHDPMAYPEAVAAMLLVYEPDSRIGIVCARLVPPSTFWPPPDASLSIVDAIGSDGELARQGVCSRGTVLYAIEPESGYPYSISIGGKSYQVSSGKGRFMMKMMPQDLCGYVEIRSNVGSFVTEGQYKYDPRERAIVAYLHPFIRMFTRLSGARGVGTCGEMRQGRYSELIGVGGDLSDAEHSVKSDSNALSLVLPYSE